MVNSPENVFEKYGFNPFQFTGPDELMRDFHRRHVSYFKGCRQVLDLGAGRGFFLREAKEAGLHAVGVENHPGSVQEGKDQGLSYFETDMFLFFQSPEGQALAKNCDGVYCAHVLEHLEPEKVFELFRAVRTHCAPGVRCRFITNNPADITVLGYVFWGDLTHRRLYPGQLLEEMARSQGFKQTFSKTFLGLKIGKRQFLQRLWEKPFWGAHKWLPNLLLDCIG
jgi:O-antigen chain-terminating methyltransferase